MQLVGLQVAGVRLAVDPSKPAFMAFGASTQIPFRSSISLGCLVTRSSLPSRPPVLVSKNGKVATAPVLATGDTGAGGAGGARSLMPDTFLELLQYSPIAAATTLASLNPTERLAECCPRRSTPHCSLSSRRLLP